MGMLTEGALLNNQQKVLKEAERTNALLTELLAEVKHANELTRSTMPQYDRQ
jgi:hypothetical protein